VANQLIVESLPFESSLNMNQFEAPLLEDGGKEGGGKRAKPVSQQPGLSSWIESLQKNPKGKMIIGGAAGGVVLLVAGLFFVLRKRKDLLLPGKQPLRLIVFLRYLKSGGPCCRRPARDEWQPSAPVASPSHALATLSAPPVTERDLTEQVRKVALRDAEVSVGVYGAGFARNRVDHGCSKRNTNIEWTFEKCDSASLSGRRDLR